MRAGSATVCGCEDLCFLQTGQDSWEWSGTGNSLLLILYEKVPEQKGEQEKMSATLAIMTSKMRAVYSSNSPSYIDECPS